MIPEHPPGVPSQNKKWVPNGRTEKSRRGLVRTDTSFLWRKQFLNLYSQIMAIGAQDWAGREKPPCEQRELFKIYMPLLLEFERTWWAKLPSERPEKKSFTLCSTWQPQLRLGPKQSSAGTRTSGWRFSQSDAEVNDSLPSAQGVSINKAISVFIVFLTVTSAQTNCIVSNHDIQ